MFTAKAHFSNFIIVPRKRPPLTIYSPTENGCKSLCFLWGLWFPLLLMKTFNYFINFTLFFSPQLQTKIIVFKKLLSWGSAPAHNYNGDRGWQIRLEYPRPLEAGSCFWQVGGPGRVVSGNSCLFSQAGKSCLGQAWSFKLLPGGWYWIKSKGHKVKVKG